MIKLIDRVHQYAADVEPFPDYFQRSLAVDYKTGLQIFNRLVDDEVISDLRQDKHCEDGQYIGHINKQRVKELLAN